MRKVTTEYRCDACEKQVKSAKELRRFKLEQVKRGRGFGPVAASDLCVDCENEMLSKVQEFFGSDELPTLHAMMSREEE